MSEKTSLGHLPEGRWAFDESVTECFDDMLRRSIPQLDVMRSAVLDVGSRFVTPHSTIVDLGCSRGDALASFARKFGRKCWYRGLEISEPMLEAARARFVGSDVEGLVSIEKHDLRKRILNMYMQGSSTSLVLSILTLQFTPIEHRLRIVRDAFDMLQNGGALVVVEKVLGASARIDGAMVELYLELKRSAGYSQEEIERKRLALEGVLVPVTAAWNEDLLRLTGFQEVDCFWRWMNFAGWVAIKP